MRLLVNYKWNTYHTVLGRKDYPGQELFFVDGAVSLGRMRRMIKEDLQAEANEKEIVFVGRIMPSDVTVLDESVELNPAEQAQQ